MWGSRQWRRVAARYADEPRAQPTMRPPRPMHRIAKATRRPPDQAPEPAQLFNSQVHSKFRPTEADPSNRCIQHSKRVAPGSGGNGCGFRLLVRISGRGFSSRPERLSPISFRGKLSPRVARSCGGGTAANSIRSSVTGPNLSQKRRRVATRHSTKAYGQAIG